MAQELLSSSTSAPSNVVSSQNWLGHPPPPVMEAGDAGDFGDDDAISDNKIKPLDNVYSYFMFMVPIEDYKQSKALARGENRGLSNHCLAYMIVFVSLFLQFVLLVAIFKKTVVEHVAWREGVVRPRPDGCITADSLCLRNGSSFSCAPPTIQLSSRWDVLDLNGDGLWTMEEAKEAQDDIKCGFGIDPVEVWFVYKKFLLEREKVIFIEPELKEDKFIRKSYFKYAAGDVIMCGYRNSYMCANLLTRGVFDAPLKSQQVPRVGSTIDSALDYCYKLLEGGGICERTLPSTYAVWRKSSEDQCGGEDFIPMVYTHPRTGDKKSMLKIDYGSRQDYKHAERSPLFVMYKASIIGIYLLAMFQEFRDICVVVIWIFKFRSTSELRDGVTMVEDGKYKINGITTRHRITMSFFMILRIMMLCLLSVVGISFLLKETDEIDLLLNGLGLIFVVEIAPLCYTQLLDPALRSECENVEPMDVPEVAGGGNCLKGRPALRDLLWMVCVLVTLYCIVQVNFWTETTPVHDALDCTCLSQGANCVEAKKFDKHFWSDYWLKTVPASIAAIEDLEFRANASAANTGADHEHAEHGTEPHSFASDVGRVVFEHSKKRRPQDEPSTVPWPLLGTVTSFLGPSWGLWGSAVSAFSRHGHADKPTGLASSTMEPEHVIYHHRKRHHHHD